MNKLLERMQSAGSIKHATILSKSPLFNDKEDAPTQIPIINLALSAKLNGGLSSGLTFLAGPAKHFKSLLGLLFVKAYMDKYPESICLFYDSEFGITKSYVTSNGIDIDRVVHIPIEHLEQLKFDISKRLDAIERNDKVIIFIDSVGNLASKKEVEDALDEKSVADMSRARVMKSLWRIVTPSLTVKDIPCVAVNHTYSEMALYPKQIMSGGTGGAYSANQIFFINKSQEKDGTELVGWNFTLVVEKSRFVREKSKFPFLVTYENGISKWSGLMDLALESGNCIKPKNGWYQKVDLETGEIEERSYRLAQTNNEAFWKPIMECQKFKDFLTKKFSLGGNKLYTEDETFEEALGTE